MPWDPCLFQSVWLTLWARTHFLNNCPMPVPCCSGNQTSQDRENKCVQNKQHKMTRKTVLIPVAFPWLNSFVKVRSSSQVSVPSLGTPAKFQFLQLLPFLCSLLLNTHLSPLLYYSFVATKCIYRYYLLFKKLTFLVSSFKCRKHKPHYIWGF